MRACTINDIWQEAVCKESFLHFIVPSPLYTNTTPPDALSIKHGSDVTIATLGTAMSSS